MTLDLLSHTMPAAMLAGIVGLLIGSFLNVVIYRLPKMMQREVDNYIAEHNAQALPHQEVFNLMLPRSCCPHCGHQISALENIPVLSFLALRGKCSACQTPISIRYPLIELLTAALSFGLIWHFGPTLKGVASLVFAYFLIALALIDFDTQLLPDSLTLPLLWIGLLVNTQEVFCELSAAVLGAALGYVTLWLIYWIFKLTTGKEGMGYGDFKLLAALGAWCGWTVLPAIVFFSSLVGVVVGFTLIWLSRHDRAKPMPFGPYLATAGLISLPYGSVIMETYLNLMW